MAAGLIYSLDTNVFVSVLRGSPAARFRLRRVQELELRACSVVLFELLIGAHASRRVVEQLQRIREALTSASIAEVTEADAVMAGQLGAAFLAQGQDIGDLDLLIAGQALNRGWAVVTENTRHFNRVPGLTVIDWSQPWSPTDV